MRIFNQVEPWTSKVNFVDENNVFLGYDMEQSCCEDANWFISDRVCNRYPEDAAIRDTDWSGWVFDTAYFHQVFDKDGEYYFDGGSMVVFRIVNGDREMFVHLYNCHNGYYGHGFDFKVNDQTIREGCL